METFYDFAFEKYNNKKIWEFQSVFRDRNESIKLTDKFNESEIELWSEYKSINLGGKSK
jgi:hypothetical protein